MLLPGLSRISLSAEGYSGKDVVVWIQESTVGCNSLVPLAQNALPDHLDAICIISTAIQDNRRTWLRISLSIRSFTNSQAESFFLQMLPLWSWRELVGMRNSSALRTKMLNVPIPRPNASITNVSLIHVPFHHNKYRAPRQCTSHISSFPHDTPILEDCSHQDSVC